MKTATVELDDILSLVSCARTYGYEDDVLFDAFAAWAIEAGIVDEDCKAYADDFLSEKSKAQGYTEEDRNESLESVMEWKKKFVDSRKKI